MMNGGIVGWGSRKQTLIAVSTTYAEYVAAHSEARDVDRLRDLLRDLRCKQVDLRVLYLDNAAAELLITNPSLHERMKQIDMKFHYVREKYQEGEIRIQHVSTTDQLANIFTKILPICKFVSLRSRIGMKLKIPARKSPSGSVERRLQKWRFAHAFHSQ